MHKDLREWLEKADVMGKVAHISGAHWEKEMAALAELYVQKKRLETPALLFDEVPGFPKGDRVLFHELITPWAVALTMDFPLHYETLVDLVTAAHSRIESLTPTPPKTVGTGPIMENVLKGKDVNLLSIPVPRFSDFDGGALYRHI